MNIPPKNGKNDGKTPKSADISKQSKVEHSKAKNSKEEKEEDMASPLVQIPEYAQNIQTHNVTGLLESLRQHKVTNAKEGLWEKGDTSVAHFIKYQLEQDRKSREIYYFDTETIGLFTICN